MMVFYKKALVFLAVPKTGTTAYEEALGPIADIVFRDPPILKHSPWYRYNRFVRPMLEDVAGRPMTTLAVVREPISWLGSWWRYRQRDDLRGAPQSTLDVSFDTFVDDYARGTKPPHAQVGSQARFLQGKDGSRIVDHVFRYEERDRLDAFLEARLGIAPRTRRINASPGTLPPLSERVDAKLRRKCAAEFDAWNAAEG